MTEAPLFAWVARLLHPRRRLARWPVLQVEVTSRCVMRCAFCPNRGPANLPPNPLPYKEGESNLPPFRAGLLASRAAGEGGRGGRSAETKGLGAQWACHDLPWELFGDHIGPHLSRFETVYLQGWGEPLLHPDLWQMAQLAKEAGCRVGFTSCGSLLLEDAITRIIDGRVDILSISFAGATAETHESLRIGSDFERLVANVRQLAECRSAAGSGLFLELHFLMMRPNLHELPAFVRLAASLGADEAVATHLTYAFTPEMDRLRVFGPAPDPAHLALVAEAQAEAARLGLKFRVYPLATSDAVLECDARPAETAFINSRGQVTPCVYLGMPVVGSAPRYFEAVDRPLTPVSFGDVRAGLLAALEGPAHRAFCGAFRQRKASARTALLFATADGEPPPLPAPPEPCRHCYKMFGC